MYDCCRVFMKLNGRVLSDGWRVSCARSLEQIAPFFICMILLLRFIKSMQLVDLQASWSLFAMNRQMLVLLPLVCKPIRAKVRSSKPTSSTASASKALSLVIRAPLINTNPVMLRHFGKWYPIARQGNCELFEWRNYTIARSAHPALYKKGKCLIYF